MESRRVNSSILFAIVLVLIVQVGASSLESSEENPIERTAIVLTRTLTFDIELSELELLKMGNYDYITSEGLRRFTRPGEPLLPMKTIVTEFDKNADILDVALAYEEHVPIEGTFDIAPTPKPVTWDGWEIGEPEKNSDVYALDDYFPGEVFSYRIGEDNYKKYLYVHIYPVQYIPSRGRIEIITDIALDITYQNSSDMEPLADDLSAECIIITPQSLYPEAKQLADFHEASLGVPTSVVNTTWIEVNYLEAPDPPYIGYSDSGLNGWNQIVGYDYSLAKKTVNYLNDTSAHPNLDYVLLYGNAQMVPPSFYWYDSWVGGFMPYQGWIPTDFFYSSPDYDLTPDYAVGRLPVDGSTRAQTLNQKIVDWYTNLLPSWFNKAVVAGGTPFNTPFYVGELITQDAVNKGYFDGFDITKMFLSDWKFDRANVLNALSGGYGVMYEIGHGLGDVMIVNDSGMPGEMITTTDIMSLSPNSNVPVVVSIACINGAFDNTIMANKPFTSSNSIGESLLFSPAGAIAYVGSSRVSTGMPIGILEEGEVKITGETTMVSLLTSFWRAHYEGAGTLGFTSMDAMTYFSSGEDMGSIENKRALFEYVLLGNPVLPFTHPQQDKYSVPRTEILDVRGYEYRGNPMLIEGQVPVVGLNKPNAVDVVADSPSVNFKIVDSEAVVTMEYGSNTTTNNQTRYDFTPSRTSLLLLRAEGEDGKEGWQYMVSKFVPNFPKAPVLRLARLTGTNDEDVLVDWYKSTDEGDPRGTLNYEVYRSLNSLSGPYSKIADIPATGQSNYNYIDPGRGDGDTDNYFYYIQSMNFSAQTARSYYAGKTAGLMSEGWWLISLPLVQYDKTTSAVFRTLDFETVVTYVASDPIDPWKRYDSFKPYADLDYVDHTMGLWVNVSSSDYLTIAGLVPKSTPIVLRPGWNLVGYPTFDERNVTTEFAGISYDRIEFYEPTSPPYLLRCLLPTEDMFSGGGYWIKVSSQQVWTVYNPA